MLGKIASPRPGLKKLLTIDRSWLEDKYAGQALSNAEIARQAGCDRSVVAREILRYGLSRPRLISKPRIVLPEAELRELYNSGRSMTDIATWFRCSEDIVRREARRVGLPSRKNIPVPSGLEGLLVGQGWLCSEVANHYGVCEDTVYKWIRLAGLHESHPCLLRRGRRGIRGHRIDLGISFRSRWEANYARILRYRGVGFEYEKLRLNVGGGRVYIPDFVLDTGEIVEVKGLSTRVNLWKFHEAVVRYPDYRFILVDKPAYVKLEAEYRHLPGWESNA